VIWIKDYRLLLIILFRQHHYEDIESLHSDRERERERERGRGRERECVCVRVCERDVVFRLSVACNTSRIATS